ncbi:hypothetical protein [Stagnimonas aquatica]|uniref:hypothetical protein n=1 Tax=Stagnimonas aquatica TaxID=2689987 RepID=UPI001315505A|nr:hypothetical protein [Stagnimonas aquatica]
MRISDCGFWIEQREAVQQLRRNPQSAIRNPQSAIRNPQSAIRNPQSAIRNPQLPRLPQTGEGAIARRLYRAALSE